MPSPDWLVVGGGIPALVAALALQRRGEKVLVVDDDRPSASRAGAGILSPLPPWRAPPAVAALAAAGAAAYPALLKDIGEDCAYRRCGMLVLPPSPLASPSSPESPSPPSAAGAVQVTTTTVEDALPPQAALHLPEVAVLNPRRLLKALRRQLPRRRAAVTRLAVRGGKVQAVQLDDGASLGAESVLLSAGAWSARLCPPPAPPIHPLRGQMLLYDNPGGVALRGVVLHEESGCYVVQREDGRLLVGSTQEAVGFRDNTTRAGRAWLRRHAATLLPPLAGRRERHHWAGLRPAAALPIIARHPAAANLYINSGHFRYGVTMAPAAAAHLLQVVADDHVAAAAANPYGFPLQKK